MRSVPILLLCSSLSAMGAAPRADLLLVKGHIYTSNPAAPWAEAVAIGEGQILSTGSNVEVEKYRGPATQVVADGGGGKDCLARRDLTG